MDSSSRITRMALIGEADINVVDDDVIGIKPLRDGNMTIVLSDYIGKMNRCVIDLESVDCNLTLVADDSIREVGDVRIYGDRFITIDTAKVLNEDLLSCWFFLDNRVMSSSKVQVSDTRKTWDRLAYLRLYCFNKFTPYTGEDLPYVKRFINRIRGDVLSAVDEVEDIDLISLLGLNFLYLVKMSNNLVDIKAYLTGVLNECLAPMNNLNFWRALNVFALYDDVEIDRKILWFLKDYASMHMYDRLLPELQNYRSEWFKLTGIC